MDNYDHWIYDLNVAQPGDKNDSMLVHVAWNHVEHVMVFTGPDKRLLTVIDCSQSSNMCCINPVTMHDIISKAVHTYMAYKNKLDAHDQVNKLLFQLERLVAGMQSDDQATNVALLQVQIKLMEAGMWFDQVKP